MNLGAASLQNQTEQRNGRLDKSILLGTNISPKSLLKMMFLSQGGIWIRSLEGNFEVPAFQQLCKKKGNLASVMQCEHSKYSVQNGNPEYVLIH